MLPTEVTTKMRTTAVAFITSYQDLEKSRARRRTPHEQVHAGLNEIFVRSLNIRCEKTLQTIAAGPEPESTTSSESCSVELATLIAANEAAAIWHTAWLLATAEYNDCEMLDPGGCAVEYATMMAAQEAFGIWSLAAEMVSGTRSQTMP